MCRWEQLEALNMTNDPPEWRRFRVGALSDRPDWTNPDCRPLTYVDHAAPALARAVLASLGNPTLGGDLEGLGGQFANEVDLQNAVFDAEAAGLPKGSFYE